MKMAQILPLGIDQTFLPLRIAQKIRFELLKNVLPLRIVVIVASSN